MTVNLIVGVSIFVIVLILVVYIFIKIYQFFFIRSTLFGSTIKNRLISLAITSIFFKQGIAIFLIGPVRMLIQMISMLYANVSQAQIANTKDIPKIITGMFTNLYDFSNFQMITSVILALACWSIIGHAIDAYDYRNSDSTDVGMRKTQQNLILGLVFLVSIYMSLAAIIAVPYFLEDDKIVVDSKQMKANLDSLNSTNVDGNFILSQNPTVIIDSSFVDRILKLRNAAHRAKASEVLKRIRGGVTMNINSRANMQRLLNDEKLKYLRAVKRAYYDAINKYNEEETNLKSKLKLSYINQLTHWFEIRMIMAMAKSEQIKSIVTGADEDLMLAQTNFNADFNSILNNMSIDTLKEKSDDLKYKTNPDNFRTSMANYYNYYLDADNSLDFGSSGSEAEYLTPGAPVPGEELGIFKEISQWLLKPRYMALVLIVGMLGFGLFGSAVSTFVKVNPDPSADSSVNVVNVIVRGASAAIVIFLAVKGGVSVFVQSETELNPYSLFLTCLIGAVYSERVWQWAKQQLEDRFNNNETPKLPIAEKSDAPNTDKEDAVKPE